MKRIKSGILALAIAAAASPAMAAGMEAAIRNCTWCHGSATQGYTVAPRLAGQRPQYLVNQLASFRNHSRDNPFSKQYMWGAAANVGRDSARELARYLAALPARAAADGPSGLIAAGGAVYDDGIPASNIVSCVVCHGPNAQGVRQIPRLGGLSYDYVASRLRQWGQGYHAAAEAPMPFIASGLPPEVIRSLAAYLSHIQ